MTRSIRTFALTAVAGLLTLALLAPTAHAQFRRGGRVPNTAFRAGGRVPNTAFRAGGQVPNTAFRAGGRVPNTVGIQGWRNANRVNPNPYLGNGLTLNQWAYNTAVMGRAYSYIPPYALGYNPYPPVVNYGPVYPVVTAPVYNPYLNYAYSPTVYNPYAYGYGLNVVNPYLP